MSDPSQDAILAALAGIRLPPGPSGSDPAVPADIVSAGAVSGIAASDGDIRIVLEVDPALGPALETMRQTAEKRLNDTFPGQRATVILSGKRAPSPHNVAPQPSGPPAARRQPTRQRIDFGRIGAVIAVASGKGGVGKSTVALNLAVALGLQGFRTGLLDADVYGPSVPTLVGLSDHRGAGLSSDAKSDVGEGGKVEPVAAHGIRVMSMGFLVPPDQALIWRGPMVQGAIVQLLRDVNWGQLDFLIIDLPPGTGDAQLTLAQQVPLAGAVIVSTPQDLALIDARKAIAMFKKTEVPILGLIENMSYFECPHCGTRSEIFGHGGAEAEALEAGIRFLGGIPLDAGLRADSDEGLPAVSARPDGAPARQFMALAENVAQAAKMPLFSSRRPPPISWVD